MARASLPLGRNPHANPSAVRLHPAHPAGPQRHRRRAHRHRQDRRLRAANPAAAGPRPARPVRARAHPDARARLSDRAADHRVWRAHCRPTSCARRRSASAVAGGRACKAAAHCCRHAGPPGAHGVQALRRLEQSSLLGSR
ncbi:DEAD (Asp-Glu-Ala-Asp) box polypeptide [Gracilaria domingensis]|nr:DEAD (Asp-Glu-Ala-Asp) box polypeptide [Gracilaria domingensis]